MSERKGTKGLELWCRKMSEGYPGVKVENMTTSWRDGLAFCAIIHHFRPDLIEFDKLNKDDIYHNNELAFRVAEHHLGIPALLEPEDMVEYEVPDRLSILTYLSQFYQTFENQRGKSGARIAPKRPQTSPDHGIVSPASTSPPTKVQVTIGRARREPCAKCGFPVFIAERLNVGKLLYHRTCFRCARCKSQLTLANYYETENGEFCCEICPDEEKQISKKISPESVLTRSLSDEEKTASLQNFADAPDAYSTHFETALEFPLDGDLKKSSTLTGTESTSFNKARSHFFKSQMENSSESSTEDIPVELPKSKPPLLTDSRYTYDSIPFDIPKPKPPLAAKPDFIRTKTFSRSDNSSFPSDEKDTKVISDSVSEQTNDRFVTKDNASSSSRLSVRARMKLFENNEDNKSDVNKFPSSRSEMPLDSFKKKKATVVAIDDLEDFDNISKKDVSIEDTSAEKNTRRGSKVHSDEISSEKADTTKESNIDLRKKEIFTTKTELVLNTNDIDVDSPINRHTETEPKLDTSNNDVIQIFDNSNDTEVSHITIDSENHDIAHKVDETAAVSCITIEDSPEPLKVNTATGDTEVAISDDSFLSAHSLKSSAVVSSSDDTAPKRGYFTAYDLSNQVDSVLEQNMSFEKSNSGIDDNIPKEKFEVPSENKNMDSAALEVTVQSESCLEPEGIGSDSIKIIGQTAEDESPVERDRVESDSIEIIEVTQEDNVPSDQNTKYDSAQPTSDKESVKEINTPEKDTAASESDLVHTNNLKLGDEKSDSPLQTPLGTPDDEKLTISTRPVPAARPKKKIIPILAERELTGTPECLSQMYVQRISRNPFDEESEEESGNTSYNPFEEDGDEEEENIPKRKKIIVCTLEEKKLWDTADSLPKTDSPKSYNPFDDDEDDEEIEAPVKPAPVPTPRTSKANRPEPAPRDTLSIASKGSHGGSNSSISSGSAFGSARKKKPAPRPPVPFLNSDSASTPGSSLASPSSSVAQSPNLSGTVRSRKTKRAPLPPNASTPANPESKDTKLRHPSALGISPINFEHTETLSDDIQKEKNVKDEENRNRQSQIIQPSHETDSNLIDKSSSGRWKRRKGQAPSRPIPQRRIVKSLPISEIKRELDTIEIQQQGLEKQGVRLEQIIREKCEGTEGSNPEDQLPIEVEDLILQLFELVNEKNELFRRQAELMYLRRQQRLEEEYADVEYQIRCLMLQPEANKSDSDKVREETLINRLVEIVERRNEIIECLEMDRRREAEEDNSISSQLNLYSAKRDGEKEHAKEEKKDKKKKHKKLTKIIHPFKHKKEKDRKIDVDKDVDESEINTSSEKEKKKKFNLF